jgi:hypothetical protein
MPFTFAHPVAAIPLYRPLGRYGVLSALILGSLTPDLWYFLPLEVGRNDSHGIAGLFWFCLPVGIAFYLLFHLGLKRPLIALLPGWLSARLSGFAPARPRLPDASWPAVIVSLLAGAATHSTWDSFTHWHGMGSKLVPALRNHLFSIGEFDVYVFNFLQHGSSCLGLAALAWWTWRWLRAAPVCTAAADARLSPNTRLLVLVALVAAAAVCGLSAAVDAPIRDSGLSAVQAFARRAIFPGLQALGIALLAYSALWHVWASRTGRAA